MAFSMIAACPQCGTGNRIPAARLSDSGRCGACKSALPPAHAPIAATAGTFDEIIAAAKVPVLVDFWADWCGPCKMIAPELHALAQEMAGRALVVKIDTESESALAARYQIRSIPNLMLFYRGRPVGHRAGAAGRAELRRWLESSITAA